MENYRIYLTEEEIPTHYYNLRADMKKKPAPLLNPGTMQPMTAEELEGVFCSELVAQELEEEKRAYQRSLEEKGASLTGTIHEAACRYPIRLGNNAYSP